MFVGAIPIRFKRLFQSKNQLACPNSRSDSNEAGALNGREKYPISVMIALGVTWNGLNEPYFLLMTKDLIPKAIANY